MPTILRLSPQMVKSQSAKGRPAVPADLDDDDLPSGPEDHLKPAVLAAFKAWSGAVQGQGGAVNPPWAAPVKGESATAFARRAAVELRKLPEANAAAASVGEGADFEDWVEAVMRFEGGAKPADLAKSLEAALEVEDGLRKAMTPATSAKDRLTPEEIKAVWNLRLYRLGQQFKSKGGKPSDGTPAEWFDGAACTTPDEFVEHHADQMAIRLTWEGETNLVRLMRHLGGVSPFLDWVRHEVRESVSGERERDPVATSVVTPIGPTA